MSNLVLYTSDDGETRLQLRLEGDTVWLTQLEIAELFQTTKQNVSLHARNIFGDQELDEDSVVKESLTTAADGKKYRSKLYNLELILARADADEPSMALTSWKGSRVRKVDILVAKNYLTADEARLADAADLEELEQLQLDLREKYQKPTEGNG